MLPSISITFTPAGLGILNGHVGGKIILGGLVGSVVPPAFPQQPFGFTGPDIPGGDLSTPMLSLSMVPTPAAPWQWLLGLAAVAATLHRRRH